MRGLEAARHRVDSGLTELFEVIDEDISHEVYTEAEADKALRELDGVVEDAWNDWKGEDER